MRRGVTLLELLLVLVVVGILLTLALPGIAQLHDRLRVDAAARALVAAHLRARFTAIAEQRTTVLDLTAARLALRAVESPADTVLRWQSAGPESERVSIAGMPHTAVFAPSGVAVGASNATYTLRRGSALRLVIVSRYGRVRMQ